MQQGRAASPQMGSYKGTHTPGMNCVQEENLAERDRATRARNHTIGVPDPKS